ncbi:MAG: cation diffusion facilitator family transporter [Arenimonas sp.]|uniref:cation diffusion facilitator family transporter n=1 Tax=Arenimonas sp. TaxID=1872635 RepID=UPI0025C3C22C|nr:cation diffusion facilitator family transporter [Arenimonas sp.]MBW8369225.1 cation diffusion facilitator family transporter [Arenimonas sp.]
MTAHVHSHGSQDAPASHGRAFAIGIALNLAFVVVEAWYGWLAGSLTLLADAAHNLSDVGGLVLAWAAYAAAKRAPDDRHTYGWRRGSILASFANAALLLVAMGSLAWEAVQRIGSASPVDGLTVMVVAGIGVVVNFGTAWLFMGHRRDLNIRGAFLHMAADGLVSVGVVIAGALTLWQGWDWIDPLVSLAVAAVVVLGTWSLFTRSTHLLFDGVPDELSLVTIRQCLLQLPGVQDVHDLHVWAMSTSDNALTAHLVVAPGAAADDVLRAALEALHHDFGIRHATVQLESAAFAAHCREVSPPF